MKYVLTASLMLLVITLRQWWLTLRRSKPRRSLGLQRDTALSTRAARWVALAAARTTPTTRRSWRLASKTPAAGPAEPSSSCAHNWRIRPYDLQMVGPQLPKILHLYCLRCLASKQYALTPARGVEQGILTSVKRVFGGSAAGAATGPSSLSTGRDWPSTRDEG